MSEISKKDVISNILTESRAYTSIELIENAVAEGGNLEHFPVQPLYTVLKSLPLEAVTAALPMMTKEQRKVCLDLDLWQRDDLDVDNFSLWVVAHAGSADEKLRVDFAKTAEFGLFLKGRFNVWTFDVDDPQYPDHDNYFLTEDNLLLVEFDENCQFVDDIRQLIKDLYTELGVEKAYQHLFKYVSEGYMSLQEEEYRLKKLFLEDYGFVDYYDSLEFENAFPSFSHVDHYIRTKEKITGKIETYSAEQTLHNNSLVAYEKGMDGMQEELSKVTSEERYEYLHFNFLRLVNATLSYEGALKQGRLAMTRVGEKTRNKMLLGYNYLLDLVKSEGLFQGEESLFDYFEFKDLHKVGNSLLKLKQKEVKKALTANQFEGEEESFVGSHFENYLDNTFNEIIRFSKNREEKALPITSLDTYREWMTKSDQFIAFAPFIAKFKSALIGLESEGLLQDAYYLNYEVKDIDFEAILLSSFANFAIGSYENGNQKKMGLTVDEYLKFTSMLMKDEKVNPQMIDEKVSEFLTTFGLNEVASAREYLYNILDEQMSGYNFSDMDATEFKHVGGPIILNAL